MTATRARSPSAPRPTSRPPAWATPPSSDRSPNSSSSTTCAGAPTPRARSCEIDEYEAPWNTGKKIEGGNKGHRPTVKGGYFPVPPVDSTQDMRAEMSLILESLGIPVEVFHHEVAGAGQNEIGTRFSTLVQRADWTHAA